MTTFRAITKLSNKPVTDEEGIRLFGPKGWAERKRRGLDHFEQTVAEGEVEGDKARFLTSGHWIDRVEIGGNSVDVSNTVLPVEDKDNPVVEVSAPRAAPKSGGNRESK